VGYFSFFSEFSNIITPNVLDRRRTSPPYKANRRFAVGLCGWRRRGSEPV